MPRQKAEASLSASQSANGNVIDDAKIVPAQANQSMTTKNPNGIYFDLTLLA